MSYEVILDNFQGPLDLLLHLIKEKEMDLETLDLSEITDQYLIYIEKMDPTQLETMSEYLVMASSLIEMKSKLLLPRESLTIDDDYEEDPRKKLIQRLIEYKKYKDILDDFKECYEERKKLHTKAPSLMEEYVVDTTDLIPEGLEVYDLIKAMQKMYQRKALIMPLESKIARSEISIDERCDEIKSYFHRHQNQKIDFEDLFDQADITYFVVTFLAVLVLVKDKDLEIEQSSNFDKIYLKGRSYE
jgi:segregation and condensation protein A